MSDILNVVVSTLELTIDDTVGGISRGDLPVVKFNQTQLLQLMQKSGGKRPEDRSAAPPEINITAKREHSAWRIAVRDNGEGFDMQYASHIFQPLTLSSGDDRGTGIGLAICRKIVEGRGGRIWVESAPGKVRHSSLRSPTQIQLMINSLRLGSSTLFPLDLVGITKLVAVGFENLRVLACVTVTCFAIFDRVSPDLTV